MRLFLAVELPAEVRTSLGSMQDMLRRRCSGWRWVRPEAVHLTLRFLGEVPEDRLPVHLPAWDRAVARQNAGEFRVEGNGVFPPRGRPRILWAGIRGQDPTGFLDHIATALETMARELGFRAENRPFRPHLTLARSKRGGRPGIPEADTVPVSAVVRAEEVVLFRSELRPEGARYTVLERFPLARHSGAAT